MTVERDELGRLQPGSNLNPNGRPKGSKNKLAHSFFDDCYAVWQERGRSALKEMADMDPASFARLVGSQMPKELDIDATSSDGSMTPPAEIRILAVEATEMDPDD
jgi:hypothetical protein